MKTDTQKTAGRNCSIADVIADQAAHEAGLTLRDDGVVADKATSADAVFILFLVMVPAAVVWGLIALLS